MELFNIQKSFIIEYQLLFDPQSLIFKNAVYVQCALISTIQI